MVGHHNARGFRQVGKPINPELPIRIECYVKATPPPEVEMHHTSLPIKCRGKKPQHPHNGERHREEGDSVEVEVNIGQEMAHSVADGVARVWIHG